jgi:hypothetical protein
MAAPVSFSRWLCGDSTGQTTALRNIEDRCCVPAAKRLANSSRPALPFDAAYSNSDGHSSFAVTTRTDPPGKLWHLPCCLRVTCSNRCSPHEEARGAVQNAPVKNTDESGWSEKGRKR